MSAINSLILYIGIYAVSATLLHAGFKIKERNLAVIVVGIAIIIPTVMAGIRFGVGTDFFNYSTICKNYAKMSLLDMIDESGIWYCWGVWIVSKISMSTFGTAMFYSIFSGLGYLCFIIGLRQYKCSNVFIASFLFLLGPFSTGLNIMKQVLAICIVFCSIKYLRERKIMQYFIIIIIAAAFHVTALVMLPFYFLYEKPFENIIWGIKKKITIVVVSILALAGTGLFVLIQNVDVANISRYIMYAGGYSSRNYTLIINLIVFLGIIIFQRDIVKLDCSNDVLLYLVAIGCAIQLTGFFSAHIARMSLYFYSIPSGILLSELPYCFEKGISRITIVFIILLFNISIFTLTYYYIGQADIIPYNTIFNK